MKWAKSRNSKNCAQLLQVARHGARMARGELARRSAARPTRRGGRAARPWAGRRRSPSRSPAHWTASTSSRPISSTASRRRSNCSPSRMTVGVPLTRRVRRRLGGVVDPVLVGQVLDAVADVRLVGARLDRQVDQLVVGRGTGRPRPAGPRRAGRGTPWRPRARPPPARPSKRSPTRRSSRRTASRIAIGRYSTLHLAVRGGRRRALLAGRASSSPQTGQRKSS